MKPNPCTRKTATNVEKQKWRPRISTRKATRMSRKNTTNVTNIMKTNFVTDEAKNQNMMQNIWKIMKISFVTDEPKNPNDEVKTKQNNQDNFPHRRAQ